MVFALLEIFVVIRMARLTQKFAHQNGVSFLLLLFLSCFDPISAAGMNISTVSLSGHSVIKIRLQQFYFSCICVNRFYE